MEKVFSLVCHQDTSRSFWADAGQYLLCARCSGFYMGATCLILFLLILTWMKKLQNDISVKTLVLAGVMILVSPLQWMLEQHFNILNSNTVRYIFGVATGSAVMWLLLSTVLKSNQAKARSWFKSTFKMCLLLNITFGVITIMLVSLWPIQFVLIWLCIVGIAMLFTALFITLLRILFSLTNLIYRTTCKFLGYI